jgi:hypothetical protein
MTTAAPGTFLDEPEPADVPGSPGDRPPDSPPLSRVEARRAQRRGRWFGGGGSISRTRAPAPVDAPPADAALPDARSRVAARRAQRHDRRRRQTIAAFVALVVSVVIIGRSVRHSDPASDATTAAVPSAVATRSSAFGLVHRSASGDADMVAVTGVYQRQAATLLIPTTALVEVPSFDVQPIGATLRLGGASLLRTSLANALGLDVGPMLVVDDAQLTALLQPAGTLSVRGGSAAGGGGGPARDRTAEDAARDLVDRHNAPELDHLVDVQAVLAAWFRALGQQGVVDGTLTALPPIAPTSFGAPDAQPVLGGDVAVVAAVLNGAAGRSAIFDTLSVEPADVAGTEAYRVKRAPLAATVARAFNGRVYGSNRIRVEILNGTGEVGLAQRVAARIIPSGAEVVLTNNAPKFDHATTEVMVYDKKFQAQARTLLQTLRVGSLKTPARKLTVVDVTIVVGKDFT